MLCIILAISISSPGIEILDQHPDEWLADGWAITGETMIDPTDYFETLTFPPADLLQCNTSFIESNGTHLWRVIMLFDGKCVALLEEEGDPRIYMVEGNKLSTSIDCSYTVVSSHDATRPWFVVDVQSDSTYYFTVDPEYATDFMCPMATYINSDGLIVGIMTAPVNPTLSRLFVPDDNILKYVRSTQGPTHGGIDYTSDSSLFAVITSTTEGRKLVAFDWEMNELWTASVGNATRPASTELSVSYDGSVLAAEWFDGFIENDGLAVFDGNTGALLARFQDGGTLSSVIVSPSGSYIGMTVYHLPDYIIDGDSTLIIAENTVIEGYNWITQFEGELAILAPHDSNTQVLRTCYSDMYIMPILHGIGDDRSALIELSNRTSEIDNGIVSAYKRLAILNPEGNPIWASNPVSRMSVYFTYRGPTFTRYSHDPVINFCRTDDSYRVICTSDDGLTIKIVTLSQTY